MTAPNHIAGGLFFTAFFCSLWNINIFSSLNMLIATVLASVLPDIDHTKSLIGKTFYPVARWIDKHFGHRTITHSLIFLAFVCFSAYFVTKAFDIDGSYNVILFFSVLSHFLLDMITLQGIPLLYPFFRNPCVIPGNPAMRMQGGKPATEAVAFMVFALAILSCWDLFSNGFWTSYNRLFGTVEHVFYEFNNSGEFLEVEYDYTENAERRQGRALLLFATESCLFLSENQNVVKLDAKNAVQKINRAAAFKTSYPYVEHTVEFVNMPIDSFNKIVFQRLVTGEIQSDQPFVVRENAIETTTKSIRFDKRFSPRLFPSAVSDTLKASKLRTLKLKKLQNEETMLAYKMKLKEYDDMIDKRKRLSDTLISVRATAQTYLINKIENELIDLNKKIAATQSPEPPQNLVKKEEIRALEAEITGPGSPVLVSGRVSCPSPVLR